jgi:hypothetical protein
MRLIAPMERAFELHVDRQRREILQRAREMRSDGTAGATVA